MDEKKVELKVEKTVVEKKAKKVLPKATLSVPTPTASKPVVIKTVKTVKATKAASKIVPKTVSKPVIEPAPINKPLAVSKPAITPNPLFSQKDIDKRLKSITSELTKVSHSFIKVASCIYWIYKSETYKTLGFDNIYDLAKSKFDIVRGTCNGFINIMIRFGKRDSADCIMEEIADKYKDYSSTQLLVMINIDDCDLEKITSKMTVKEIKAFKKSLELPDKEKDKKKELPIADDSSDFDVDNSDNNIVDVKSKDVNRQVLLTLKDLDDYNSHLDAIECLILNTLSNKNHPYKIEISCSYE